MHEIIVQLLLAILVGGLVGAEREFHKGVGLRTLMLISLGSTLFTIFSDIFVVGEGDPRRIAAAVVTGIGFLGAGMILRDRGSVIGLTTAASVWLVAALGMGIGMGQYLMVAVATLLVLIVLWAIPRLQRLSNARKTYTYEAVCELDDEKYHQLSGVITGNDLHITQETVSKKGDQMRCEWRVYGKPDNHETTMVLFLRDRDVHEFRVL